MNKVERAMDLALDAHRGQTDKAGVTYITHPIRVMQSVEGREEKVVALLHDVVEDSEKSFEDLEEHFHERIVSAVKCLTKRDDESYMEFIRRCKYSDLARKVKMADIRDNMDVSRLDELDDEDLERMKKYSKSIEILKQEEEDS